MNEKAKTLKYYFRTLFEKSGLEWTSDNDAEIESIIEEIVKESVNFSFKFIRDMYSLDLLKKHYKDSIKTRG